MTPALAEKVPLKRRLEEAIALGNRPVKRQRMEGPKPPKVNKATLAKGGEGGKPFFILEENVTDFLPDSASRPKIFNHNFIR